MEDKSSLLLAFRHFSSLFHTHAADDIIDGDAEVLESIRNHIQCLESFLQRCLRVDPQDHDSAIGTPSNTNDVRGTTEAQFPAIPHLNPNPSPITPLSAFFDYSLYARDQPPGQDPSGKGKHGEEPEDIPARYLKRWRDLDLIKDKVVSRDIIYKRLVEKAGNYASDTVRLTYLTCLFFHYGGPYAFERVGKALSAISRSEKSDLGSTGGRIRALVRIRRGTDIEELALVVALYGERRERARQLEQTHNQDEAEKKALHDMMACAYPKLKSRNNEYKDAQKVLQQKLYDGRNFFKSQEGRPSAMWMFPSNLPEKEFRRLPEELLFAFFDVLYEYRGDFLQRVDTLLGPQVANFVAGERPVRPIAFDKSTSQMKKHSMDSEYFIDLIPTLASDISQHA